MNEIICSRLLTQRASLRFLPSRLRGPAEKLLVARTTGVLDAARLGQRTRRYVLAGLEHFEWSAVAARMANGPSKLTDNEFFAFGDYSFNCRGPLNGDPPGDYAAIHTSTTSDIAAADEIPGFLD